MYRIVKRIVHTVTTVTWLVRLEDDSEKEITFPSSYSITEEEVLNTGSDPKLPRQSLRQTLGEEEHYE